VAPLRLSRELSNIFRLSANERRCPRPATCLRRSPHGRTYKRDQEKGLRETAPTLERTCSENRGNPMIVADINTAKLNAVQVLVGVVMRKS
jgi:hypothetical protein